MVAAPVLETGPFGVWVRVPPVAPIRIIHVDRGNQSQAVPDQVANPDCLPAPNLMVWCASGMVTASSAKRTICGFKSHPYLQNWTTSV